MMPSPVHFTLKDTSWLFGGEAFTEKGAIPFYLETPCYLSKSSIPAKERQRMKKRQICCQSVGWSLTRKALIMAMPSLREEAAHLNLHLENMSSIHRTFMKRNTYLNAST
eukprot:m.67462 g.67462  ORF g.67462 m.67462 type:complete len:110 (+) comp35447_c0_seq2:629-958(+)